MVKWIDSSEVLKPTVEDLVVEYRDELIERVKKGEIQLEEVLLRLNYCLDGE